MYTNSKIGGRILKVYLRDFPFIKDQDIILGSKGSSRSEVNVGQGSSSLIEVKGQFVYIGLCHV